jgi:hypothetical protein
LILRMVRGRVLPGRREPLRAGLVAAFYPRVRETEGIAHAHAALRAVPDGDEFAFITTWTTPDAEMAVLGRSVERVGSMSGVSEHLDPRSVEHYEIDESLLARSVERPTIVRIAVGSVELGSDVEIQQELRRRLESLGDDIVEAHVGRRIRGRMVEVAFVTLWSRRPPDQSLDEPLWPDVAERYQSYWIETYDLVSPD